MPFISVDDLIAVYDHSLDEKPLTPNYIPLLNKVILHADNPKEKATIDQEIRAAIRAYFNSPNPELILKRLSKWSGLLQAANEGSLPEDLESTGKYMHRIITEELLSISNQIVAKTPDSTHYLNEIIFLEEDGADLSTVSEQIRLKPELLVSPVITYILVQRTNAYAANYSGNETINEFAETLRTMFEVNTPDLFDNPYALKAWLIFWICQENTQDNINILQNLISKYYENSYAIFLGKILAFTAINSVSAFPILGKLLLTKLPKEQITEIKNYLQEYFKEELHQKQLLEYCKSKINETNTLDDFDLKLILMLPPTALANESLLKNIVEIITASDTHPNVLRGGLMVLFEIAKALSVHQTLNPKDVIESIQEMSSIFSIDLHKFSKVELRLLVMCIRTYFKANERKDMLIEYILQLEANAELTDNHISLLTILPENGDPRIVSLLCRIIETKKATPELKATCHEALAKQILRSNSEQLLNFIPSINNKPELIKALLQTCNTAKYQNIQDGTKKVWKEFVKEADSRVLNEIAKLQRANLHTIRLIDHKYGGINMQALLKIAQQLLNEHTILYQQASTEEARKTIQLEFAEKLCAFVATKNKPAASKLKARNLANLYDDLIELQQLNELELLFTQFRHLYNMPDIQERAEQQTFNSKFIAIVTKEAQLEETEEDDYSVHELTLMEMTENEKAEMLKLLNQQLDKLIKRPGSTNAKSEYEKYILENLKSKADIGKYLRAQKKVTTSTSSAVSRIDVPKTLKMIEKLLLDDFPLQQEIPDMHTGGDKKRGRYT